MRAPAGPFVFGVFYVHLNLFAHCELRVVAEFAHGYHTFRFVADVYDHFAFGYSYNRSFEHFARLDVRECLVVLLRDGVF